MRPRQAFAVTVGLVLLVFGFLLYVGSTVVANGAPNDFVNAAIVVFCLSVAIGIASGNRTQPSILRIKWTAHAVMASLFAVGAALEGGPGIVGAILFLCMAAFWWWLLVKIRWTDRQVRSRSGNS
jgi:hypothetical protein